MKIFDTYSQKNHEFKNSITKINMYVCGPTVYNHVHLGNIRPLIIFDVLVRYLQFLKIKVKYVHNITDIDDKIIKQAISENINELVLSKKYMNSYLELIKKLNIIPMQNPKVSDYIPEIIEYINKLIDKNYAYVIDGNVYFDVKKVKSYGKLSKIKLDDLFMGERIEVNTDKKNSLDFVLWKKTKLGIVWNSPWSKGRPGWHTECSYLINKFFDGETITIHGGGIDLRFPHHENENAQNIALTGRKISKYWMHVGHLNIDNQKMSKSTNNFILVNELLKKFDYSVIRWLFYQNHYRSPLNFNNVTLNNSIKDIEKIFLTLNKAKTILISANKSLPSKFKVNKEFLLAIEDDLNFANSTKVIWNLIHAINNCIKFKEFNKLFNLCEELLWCLSIYGIEPKNLHNKNNVKLIKEWSNKLKNKNFVEADKLREKIIKKKLF